MREEVQKRPNVYIEQSQSSRSLSNIKHIITG